MMQQKNKRKVNQVAEKLYNIEKVENYNVLFHLFPKLSKKVWLAVLASIILFVAITAPYALRKIEDKKYKDATENIKRIFNNLQEKNDFVPSAQQFHQLAAEEHDNKFSLLYLLMEARAYYFQATLEPGKAEIYANHALSLIDAVKKQSEYAWMYYYALAIESNCYKALKIQFHDEKWVSIISELEDFTDKNEVNWDNFYSPMVFEEVYSTLAAYFRQLVTQNNLFTAFNNSRENFEKNQLLTEKMLRYQKLYTDFCFHLTEDSGVKSVIIDYYALISLYDSQINSIVMSFNFSFSTVEDLAVNCFANIKALDNIIEECNFHLKDFKYNNRHVNLYIGLNRLIAKSLLLQSICYRTIKNTELEKKCADKCHDIVARMLRLPDITDEETVYEISYICSYMFLSGVFDEKDVEYFYDNSLKVLKSERHNNEDILGKETTVYLICSDCKKILERYAKNQKIYELGLRCVRDLETYLNIEPNFPDKENIKELSLYFHNFGMKNQ